MATQSVSATELGATARRDRWWVAPAATASALTAFGIYSIVVALMNSDYLYTEGGAKYLSPFYSPDLKSWGLHISFTYAFFVMWVPLGFRLTCYYYRGAYYRAFWRAPSACAVREPHAKYSGETRFPLIAQNVHRYFWYAALFVGILLTYDVAQAFRGPDGNFGIGLGSLILLANVIFIWGYTLGCHTCRHITAGRLKNFSTHPVRYWAWTKVSWLNARHLQFAWISLGTLMLSDLYIMLLASGAFSDPRIFN